MQNVVLRWLPPALIGLSALASVSVYGRVPAIVDLRLEALLPFSVTPRPGLAPRALALFLVPALALILWMAFRWARTSSGQRVARRMFRHAPEEVTSPAQFDRFSETYDTIVLAVVVLCLGLHAAVLAALLQAPALAARIVPAVFGGCLILMGNVMPRLRPNWVAGFRTKRVLEDPQLWRSTHRAFGTALVVSGLATVIVAAVAPRFGLFFAIGALLVSLAVGVVASTRGRGAVANATLVAIGLLAASASATLAQRPIGSTTQVELSAPATFVPAMERWIIAQC